MVDSLGSGLIHPVSLYDFLALLALHSNRTSQELLPEPCIMVLIHLLCNQHSDVFWTIWFLPVKVNHGKSMVKPKTPRCAIFCRTISSSDRQDTPERTEVPVFVATRFPAGNRGGLGPVSLIEGRCPQGNGFHSAVAFPKYNMQNHMSHPTTSSHMGIYGSHKWTKPHKSIKLHWGIGKKLKVMLFFLNHQIFKYI